MHRITHMLYALFLCLFCAVQSAHAVSPFRTISSFASRFPKTLAAFGAGATSATAASAYYQLPYNTSRTHAHVAPFHPQATPDESDAIARVCYRHQLTEKPAGFAVLTAGALHLAQMVGFRTTPRIAACCSALSGIITAYFLPSWYDAAVEMHAIRAARSNTPSAS